MSWREDAVFWFGAITAAATSVMALFGIRSFQLQSRISHLDMPRVLVWCSIDGLTKDQMLHFKVVAEDVGRWNIESVTAWPVWKPLIAGHNEDVRYSDDGRQIFTRKELSRRVYFEFPKAEDFISLRHGWSGIIALEFKLCLLASPTVKSRFIVRQRINP